MSAREPVPPNSKKKPPFAAGWTAAVTAARRVGASCTMTVRPPSPEILFALQQQKPCLATIRTVDVQEVDAFGAGGKIQANALLRTRV